MLLYLPHVTKRTAFLARRHLHKSPPDGRHLVLFRHACAVDHQDGRGQRQQNQLDFHLGEAAAGVEEIRKCCILAVGNSFVCMSLGLGVGLDTLLMAFYARNQCR
jgi:hypothetical protein